MLKGVEELKAGRPVPDIAEFFGFNNWNEVVAFADTTEGEHLQTFVNIVQSHGESQLIWALRKAVDENESNLVVSIAHKAKGREWDNVRHMDDFLKSRPKTGKETPKAESESAAELRLLYVAMTRAKQAIDIPEPLLNSFGIVASPSTTVTPPSVAKPPVSAAAAPERAKPSWAPPLDWTPPEHATPTPRSTPEVAPSSQSITAVEPTWHRFLRWLSGM